MSNTEPSRRTELITVKGFVPLTDGLMTPPNSPVRFSTTPLPVSVALRSTTAEALLLAPL